MSAVADQEKAAWKRVDSREAWEQFRNERLNALREWMGTMPDLTPLHAEVTRRLDLGKGFVIENVVYESRPGLLVDRQSLPSAENFRPDSGHYRGAQPPCTQDAIRVTGSGNDVGARRYRRADP